MLVFRFIRLDSYIASKVEGGTQFLVLCALYRSTVMHALCFSFSEHALCLNRDWTSKTLLYKSNTPHTATACVRFSDVSLVGSVCRPLHGRLVRCPTVEARTGWTPPPYPPLASIQQRLRENESLTMLRYWPALERREVRQGHSIG